jgi:UDP-N-acetylmuramoyl-L-alanyl-D-glutamate--2,6-diaminopimelate ligase
MEEYFETKAALFASPLVARRVIDIDTDFGRRLARRCEEAGQAAVTCGFSEDAQLRACDVSYGADCSTFTLRTPETSLRLSYPLIGAFNASNVLVATGLALALGFSLDEVAAALVEAPQVPGRLERVRARAIAAAAADQPPIGVFVDYAHTPDSIAKAIDALRVTKAARVIIVFGCGGDRDRTKRPLMGKAALAADYAIVTSDNPRGEDPLAIIADILPGMDGATDRYEVICERREAIARALSIARPGDLVLIAGKGHEDYQLVEGRRLPFDDRLVASEEMRALVDAGHWQKREKGGPSCA